VNGPPGKCPPKRSVQTEFTDAGLGVNLAERTVVFGVGNGNFDGQQGGHGMRMEVVAACASDDGKVRHRLGIAQGERFFTTHHDACRQLRREEILKTLVMGMGHPVTRHWFSTLVH